MNIFYVHQDPKSAAEYLCDKHVVKMTLETAQLLSIAHRVLDGINGTYHLFDERENVLYRTSKSQANHPCSIWARNNVENYTWLLEHFKSLLNEYNYRYKKIHKSNALLTGLMKPPHKISEGTFFEPPCAMPEKYITASTIENYREYYIHEKLHFASWKERSIPTWITFGYTRKNQVL